MPVSENSFLWTYWWQWLMFSQWTSLLFSSVYHSAVCKAMHWICQALSSECQHCHTASQLANHVFLWQQTELLERWVIRNEQRECGASVYWTLLPSNHLTWVCCILKSPCSLLTNFDLWSFYYISLFQMKPRSI